MEHQQCMSQLAGLCKTPGLEDLTRAARSSTQVRLRVADAYTPPGHTAHHVICLKVKRMPQELRPALNEQPGVPYSLYRIDPANGTMPTAVYGGQFFSGGTTGGAE